MSGTLAPTKDRDALARLGLPLVRHIAAIHARPIPRLFDEFESAGLVGLARAVAKFDPARGVGFKTFAAHCIRSAILDCHRDMGLSGYRRRTDAAPKVYSLEGDNDPDGFDPTLTFRDTLPADEEGPDRPPALDLIRDVCRPLPAVHRAAMRLLYGHAATDTLAKTAEHLGLSESRIRLIRDEAITWLRDWYATAPDSGEDVA